MTGRAIFYGAMQALIVAGLTATATSYATISAMRAEIQFIRETLQRHESDISTNRREIGETNKRQSAAIAERQLFQATTTERLRELESSRSYPSVKTAPWKP